MRVSAVVLNWRDDDRTLRCVSALLSSPEIEHVFVVDNESSGTLAARLGSAVGGRSRDVSLAVFLENRGFAGGINGSIQASLDQGFDAVLAINNDATIDTVSLSHLVHTLSSRPRVGLVGPCIVLPDGSEESAGGFLMPLLGITAHSAKPGRQPDFVTWACALVRSDALRDVGLLDEAFFMYWEDVDFSRRLHAAGWESAICSDAVAVHEISTNRGSHPVAIKAYHTWSSIVYARKYGGRWKFGNVAWLTLSAVLNFSRGRFAVLRGLRLGSELAREAANPAYLSLSRTRELGLPAPSVQIDGGVK
jgi:GT2 family glycosyltransferase